MNTDCNHIEKLIGTLAELLLESVKLKVTQSVFVSILQPILLEQTKILKIWDKIDLMRDAITQMLSKTEISPIKFSGFNWRLEHTVSFYMLSMTKVWRLIFTFGSSLHLNHLDLVMIHKFLWN